MSALKVNNLSKRFRDLQAVNSLSLTVEQGDFYALLGPNGAGKSTLINMISTLLVQDSGSIEILGHDTIQKSFEAKKDLGIVPQEFNFGIFDKVIDIILNQAGYYGIDPSSVYDRAVELLDKLDLLDKKDQQARMLSGGMKRRLMIARALIHSPKILILDEPTAGVDIEIRRNIWGFLKAINEEGLTIILTTHYLEEAELLCNKVGIIQKGQLLQEGTVRDLLQGLNEQIFVCEVENQLDMTTLHDHPFTAISKTNNHTLEVSIKNPLKLKDLFTFLAQKDLVPINIQPKNNRLEDIFLKLTSQGA